MDERYPWIKDYHTLGEEIQQIRMKKPPSSSPNLIFFFLWSSRVKILGKNDLIWEVGSYNLEDIVQGLKHIYI